MTIECTNDTTDTILRRIEEEARRFELERTLICNGI